MGQAVDTHVASFPVAIVPRRHSRPMISVAGTRGGKIDGQHEHRAPGRPSACQQLSNEPAILII